MATFLRSRRVLLGSGSRRTIEPATLALDGSRIAAVDRMNPASFDRSTASTKALSDTIDLGDHLITPAFVDAHTHLALCFLRGAWGNGVSGVSRRDNLVEDVFFHYEQKLSAQDVRAFARMGAYECLLSGTGLVWDHYYFGEAIAEALLDTGLSGVVAPTLQDLDGPGKGRHQGELEATARLASNAHLAGRGIFAAFGPHAPDTVSTSLLTRVAAAARTMVLPVHMHVAQSVEELERVHSREGSSPLAYLDEVGLLAEAPAVVLAHGLYCATQDLALLDAQRHTLVFCPHSQMVFGFVGPIAEWSKQELRWAVGTDCAASNDSMSVQKELKIIRGLPGLGVTASAPYQKLLASGRLSDARAAWRLRSKAQERSPAADTSALLSHLWEIPGAMHPGFRAGVIEPGALANLVVWDTDHPAFWPERDLLGALALGDTSQAIHAMFVAGRAIGKVGDFARSVLGSDAYREARLEATERMLRLFEQDDA